jgi:hypothetical protein
MELEFQASDADVYGYPCLFVLMVEDGPTLLMVYVDDMLIAAPPEAVVAKIMERVLNKFEARDMGEATLFLGMSVICGVTRTCLLM